MSTIEVKNVTKKYKNNGKDFIALNNVSFNVEKGEIFGLLGPNGAGKTTLLNIMIGILYPDNGSIKVFGSDPAKNRDVLTKISFLSAESRFHWALKPKDILNFFARSYGLNKEERKKKIEELVELFEIKDLLNKKFDYLSTGERMRLAFAKSLINDPEVLILDEPTLGLDPDISIKIRREIKRINKEFKKTILLTSHYMNEVEFLADRIAFMNHGKLLDIGNVDEVLRKHFSSYDLVVTLKEVKDKEFLNEMGFEIKGKVITKKMYSGEDINEILSALSSKKFNIIDFRMKKPTLDDYFVEKARGDKN